MRSRLFALLGWLVLIVVLWMILSMSITPLPW